MIDKPEMDALKERAVAAHIRMGALCKKAGMFRQSWHRAYVRGRIDDVSFRKLSDALAIVEAKNARIAICSICDRRSNDPAVASCTAVYCGLAEKRAA